MAGLPRLPASQTVGAHLPLFAGENGDFESNEQTSSVSDRNIQEKCSIGKNQDSTFGFRQSVRSNGSDRTIDPGATSCAALRDPAPLWPSMLPERETGGYQAGAAGQGLGDLEHVSFEGGNKCPVRYEQSFGQPETRLNFNMPWCRGPEPSVFPKELGYIDHHDHRGSSGRGLLTLSLSSALPSAQRPGLRHLASGVDSSQRPESATE
ncbi:hypothetical protein C8R47DRAFT_1072653 [Mycena vitilis]|nr:hypothetical protein C8R47DRAFT_1072653 [Mycena vitilis]